MIRQDTKRFFGVLITMVVGAYEISDPVHGRLLNSMCFRPLISLCVFGCFYNGRGKASKHSQKLSFLAHVLGEADLAVSCDLCVVSGVTHVKREQVQKEDDCARANRGNLRRRSVRYFNLNS